MSERRRVVGAVVGASAICGILLVLRPLPTERVLAIYVLLLAAVALASLTRLAQTPEPERRAESRFERALRARWQRPSRPPELVRTERELTLAASTSGHLHRRLLPLLREIAAARGVPLERPNEARALLGDEAWELLRPDRAEPADRNAPGLPLPRIAALVDRLEAL